MSRITNFRTISDTDFLEEAASHALSAIEAGNAWLAYHWAQVAASFAVSAGLTESQVSG